MRLTKEQQQQCSGQRSGGFLRAGNLAYGHPGVSVVHTSVCVRLFTQLLRNACTTQNVQTADEHTNIHRKKILKKIELNKVFKYL